MPRFLLLRHRRAPSLPRELLLPAVLHGSHALPRGHLVKRHGRHLHCHLRLRFGNRQRHRHGDTHADALSDGLPFVGCIRIEHRKRCTQLLADALGNDIFFCVIRAKL